MSYKNFNPVNDVVPSKVVADFFLKITTTTKRQKLEFEKSDNDKTTKKKRQNGKRQNDK
jgi:hypothetical protein